MERGVVESLFDDETPHPAERDALRHLLAAATGPARPHELAGEDLAVAAFRRCAPDAIATTPIPATPIPVRRGGRRALLARLLTVKVAAAFAVTTLGGAAVAAATGTLPDIPGTAGFGARTVPAAPPTTTSARSTHNGGRAGAPAAPASPTPSASPPPTLVDLCRTFLADVDGKPAPDRERTRQDDLKNPAFAPLVTAAGGKGRTTPYCVRLLKTPGVGDAAPPGVSPTPRPSKATGGDTGKFSVNSPNPKKSPKPHHSKPIHSRNAG